MTLAELSLKRPVTAVMFFVSLTVVGLLAATRLPLEYMPDIEAPFLFVQIPYAGSTPAEIERTITRPVEEALATIPGIQSMNSNSRALIRFTGCCRVPWGECRVLDKALTTRSE